MESQQDIHCTKQQILGINEMQDNLFFSIKKYNTWTVNCQWRIAIQKNW